MTHVTIPQDLAQALHDYLMRKPMIEVEGLVVALRQSGKPQETASSPDLNKVTE